jgi:hypothetical protein
LVDDGTIGDEDETDDDDDDDEELPVEGGSDKGVVVEKVAVLFEGTKRKKYIYMNQYRCDSIQSVPVLIKFGILLDGAVIDCGCGGNRVI